MGEMQEKPGGTQNPIFPFLETREVRENRGFPVHADMRDQEIVRDSDPASAKKRKFGNPVGILSSSQQPEKWKNVGEIENHFVYFETVKSI